jgi:hypothetical protein
MYFHKTIDKLFHYVILCDDNLPFSLNFLNVFDVIDFGMRNEILHGIVIDIEIFLVEKLVLGAKNMMIVLFPVFFI